MDKYVWAIRCYKTRSEATDACNGNKVQLNGSPAKPSKAVKVGDAVSVRKGSALLSYKVLQLTENRLGAKLVPEYALNTTPQSELDKLHAPVETFFVVDSMVGQDAVNTAKVFNERLPLTGIILTKLDGTAKGGIAVAIHSELGIPIKYIGVGEKIEDLQKFDADAFVSALFDQETAGAADA